MKIVVAIYSCVNDDDGYGLMMMMNVVGDGVYDNYDGEGRHVDIHDYCYGGGWDGSDVSTYQFVHHVHYYSLCPHCRIIDGLFHPHVIYAMVNDFVGRMTNWR